MRTIAHRATIDDPLITSCQKIPPLKLETATNRTLGKQMIVRKISRFVIVSEFVMLALILNPYWISSFSDTNQVLSFRCNKFLYTLIK